MKEFNKTVANNLATLRKKNKLTQVQLAEQLCYSDKAISKWETGEALPDVEVLHTLTELYGVTLDYLVTEHDENEVYVTKNADTGNKVVITLLSMSVVWLISTIAYVYLKLLNHNPWQLFIWSFPVSALVCLIFTAIWGRKIHVLVTTSTLVWTLLGSIFIQFLRFNIWPIFLIGVPFQISIILWSQLKRPKRSNLD